MFLLVHMEGQDLQTELQPATRGRLYLVASVSSFLSGSGSNLDDSSRNILFLQEAPQTELKVLQLAAAA